VAGLSAYPHHAGRRWNTTATYSKQADELAANAATTARNNALHLALERGRTTKDAWKEAAEAAAQAAQYAELAAGQSEQIAAIVMQQVFAQVTANGRHAIRDAEAK
jgi:hypothetical protein